MSYLPRIQEISEEMISVLVEDHFFEDYQIENFEFAKKRFCDALTNKFIIGELDLDDAEIFTDDELDVILKEIVAESVLRELEKNGYINSYEDENIEETFFLTEKGRGELEKLENVEDIETLRFLFDDNKESEN